MKSNQNSLHVLLYMSFDWFVCPCFTPSQNALAESAQETVSRYAFNFIFVSSKRLYDITWLDRFLRSKGDSTALQ